MNLSLPESACARRILAGTLIVLGAVLIFIAPETWPGMALLALGVLVELIGMWLGHHRRSHLTQFHDSP